jgi:hypothetical protein
MAISKKSLKVAYSQAHAQAAEVPAGASRLVVADVTIQNGAPVLTNKTVYGARTAAAGPRRRTSTTTTRR